MKYSRCNNICVHIRAAQSCEESWAVSSTWHDIEMGCVDIFRSDVPNFSVDGYRWQRKTRRVRCIAGVVVVVFWYLSAATFTIEECSWRNVLMWWGHFNFEAYMGYVIIMKTLWGTIATIYPSTHPRYVYGVGLWTQIYLSVVSITQAPWGGSTFQPINTACQINWLQM